MAAMNAILEYLRAPWPWWISGPLVGAMVPLLLVLANKHFGVSSSLRHLCAACLPARAAYFRYEWRKESWNLALVLGVVIGAAIASTFLDGTRTPDVGADARAIVAGWGLAEPSGLVPPELFSWSALANGLGWLFMVLGGFCVGFGARWANGCTSGHAIMGLSLRSPGSLVAVIGFFIGGLAVAWLVIPAVLA